MRRLLPLSLLLFAIDAGRMAQAQQPAAARPTPALDRLRNATEPSPPVAPAPERRRFFGLFHRPSPPAPSRASEVPSPPTDGRVQIAPRQTRPGASDAPIRRVQAGPGDMGLRLGPGEIPPTPETVLPASPTPVVGGQSLSLQAALYGALTSNPDLISMRAGNVAGNVASPEAVEVARRFPTTLNPTLWVDVRPWANERVPGGIAPNGRYRGPSIDHKDALMYFSLRQPIELGHQTRYRYAIAKAALSQQQWTVLQAELLALVQTYRFFQTAAYRREKLGVARDLADFNDRLVKTLKRRLEAGQVTADVITLAEVEAEATRQQVAVARQDYATALTDLRNQIGTPRTAGTAEPLGEFILPTFIPEVDDQALIETALRSRPEIHAARAQVEGARAAVGLAKGDRIPTPVVGPVYERDEQGTQFFGFVYITPIPVVNNGMPLVRQREAELRRACVGLQQVQERTVAQVTAATAKWNEANRLVAETGGLTDRLKTQVGNMERLFEAGQTDLSKLLQARQRLIQLENSRLDATWQATQAQADLLTALGAPNLIDSLRRSAVQGDSATAASPVPPAPGPSPFRPAAAAAPPSR
jgi:cobalt-zinc-cadmium efflux system outer membrane protein